MWTALLLVLVFLVLLNGGAISLLFGGWALLLWLGG